MWLIDAVFQDVLRTTGKVQKNVAIVCEVKEVNFKKFGQYFQSDYGLLSYDNLRFYRWITIIDNNMLSQLSGSENLKMEAAYSSETVVPTCETTWCHNPQYHP